MKLKKTSLITRRIPISMMFKCGEKNKTRKPVIFQTLRNENYILISETLKREEKNLSINEICVIESLGEAYNAVSIISVFPKRNGNHTQCQ